ncbi:MAG: hypothetical protein ACOZF0_21020 [Thermodesulfobacteriota bacterium]
MFLFHLALIVFLSGSPSWATEYDDGYAAGTNTATSIMKELGDSDKINTRLQVPLTSDTSPMTTFNSTYADPDDPGPQDFKVKLNPASSGCFLELKAIPGPSGDIVTLTLQQDTNLDNVFDTAYTAPVIVSGVCKGGVIACDSGTWNNCRFYVWRVNAGSAVYLEEVEDITHLDGCYCLNTHCGSDLVAGNMDFILKNMGGGVVAAIQKSTPNVLVTAVSVDTNSIQYYGQRSSDMGTGMSASGMYFSGSSTPQVFYDPESRILPAAREVQAQLGDPASPYRQLQKAYDARLHPRESRSCVISHSISIDPSGSLRLSNRDTCASLDVSGCVLDREEICDYDNSNCLLARSDGNPTGLSPVFAPVSITDQDTGLSYLVTTTGTAVSYQINGMEYPLASGPDLWWNIRRNYLCDTGVTFNTGEALAIAGTASGSARKTGNLMSYDEYDPETGATTLKNADLPVIPEHPSCEMACKVRLNSTNTQAGATANTWDYHHSVASIQVMYKSCGAEQVCPVGPGETMIQDCACLNEFANAASHMQVLDNAAHDMICAP